jgi:hypothetical protein
MEEPNTWLPLGPLVKRIACRLTARHESKIQRGAIDAAAEIKSQALQPGELPQAFTGMGEEEAQGLAGEEIAAEARV